jgi:sulfite exporter TauE/SafE
MLITPYLGLLSILLLPIHCMVMCGPSFLIKSKSAQSLFLMGRMISYTFVGSIAGLLGQTLFGLLEIDLLKYISFFGFLVISLVLIGSWFGFSFLPKSWLPRWQDSQSVPAFFQGLFSVAIPCSIIYQMVGLSILSKSLLAGLLIGALYSFVTGWFIWLGARSMNHFLSRFSPLRSYLRFTLGLLIILSLIQISSKFWSAEFIDQLSPMQRTLLCI